MHWDPGPYWNWNWEHYMAVLGKPLAPQHGKSHAKSHAKSHVVTIVPGFADNPQAVSNCDGAGTATPCPTQGTNFGYRRTAPSESAPPWPTTWVCTRRGSRRPARSPTAARAPRPARCSTW